MMLTETFALDEYVVTIIEKRSYNADKVIVVVEKGERPAASIAHSFMMYVPSPPLGVSTLEMLHITVDHARQHAIDWIKGHPQELDIEEYLLSAI